MRATLSFDGKTRRTMPCLVRETPVPEFESRRNILRWFFQLEIADSNFRIDFPPAPKDPRSPKGCTHPSRYSPSSFTTTPGIEPEGSFEGNPVPLSSASQGQMAARALPTSCAFPGCPNSCCVENGKVHAYCGITHAREAQKRASAGHQNRICEVRHSLLMSGGAYIAARRDSASGCVCFPTLPTV